MESDKILLGFVIFTVFIVFISFIFMYLSFNNFLTIFSGRAASSTGETNLTVESSAAVNFTIDSLNWRSGRVNNGFSSAYLDTAAGTVVNGNWTTVTSGLQIQNTGNLNVTLNLSVGKSAASFIGGTGPVYKWNITNHEANSCLNSSGGTGSMGHLGIYYNPNTTSALFCPVFQFADTADTLNISINLTVPSDSITGTLNDIVTATVY